MAASVLVQRLDIDQRGREGGREREERSGEKVRNKEGERERERERDVKKDFAPSVFGSSQSKHSHKQCAVQRGRGLATGNSMRGWRERQKEKDKEKERNRERESFRGRRKRME